MPVEPIKIRCGRCQQLLGVAPSRAGSSVPCPRCGTAVRVPHPAPAEAPAPEQPWAAAVDEDDDTPSDEPIALDILEIRPEDIRAEGASGGREPLALRPRPRPAVVTEPGPAPVDPSPRRGPPPIPIDLAADEPDPDDDDEDDEPEDEPIVPPIQVEDRPTLRESPRTLAARPTDLVLPRVVVAAWSLLVLLAVSFAFVAGLLAGHYVWKVH